MSSDPLFAIKRPDFICNACGRAYGKHEAAKPNGKMAGAPWHAGFCGICGANTEVTEPRDFGGFRNDLWKVKIDARLSAIRRAEREEVERLAAERSLAAEKKSYDGIYADSVK